MELVEFFKDAVNSIVDHRPPVSKAKMAQITRAAIKAIRFYKHVVMAVERFIERCPPEYKVAGLYVIDSIVRQSRHQNGKERDIFGPRFARNLYNTFDYLFTGCIREDRPRIVRVLNLWQKNGVFNAKTIQPLLDLASIKSGGGAPDGNSSMMEESTSMSSNQNELSQNIIAGNSSSGNGILNVNNSVIGISNNSSVNSSVRISKSVLDFDYGEDDDDDADETPTEAEPPLSSTLNKIEMEHRRGTDLIDNHSSSRFHSKERDPKPSPSSQSHSLSSSQYSKSNDPDPVLERWNKLMKGQSGAPDTPSSDVNPSQSIDAPSSQGTQSTSYSSSHRDRTNHNNHISTSSSTSSSHHHHHHHRSKHHQKQTARPTTPSSGSPKARSSPTNNSSHKAKLNDAEKDADRKRKCFPKIKDRHLTLCSSTLWLGHVPKSVTEADISDAFGEFGTINSIDLIPPRGCSYVCMDRRQDAHKALSESRDLKLKGSRIKMAWAPGKGLKEYKDFKDYFELSNGCAFIPYHKITTSIDLDTLEEGGVIDEDSMSMEMIESRERKAKEKLDKTQKPSIASGIPVSVMPIITQSPYHLPPSTMTTVPPPPPPAAWVHGQSGGIPFPPPRLTTATTEGKALKPTQSASKNLDSGSKLDNDSSVEVPISIEHKISITEQQINMVEQQLNMIQQSQNANLSGPMGQMVGPHQLLNQPNAYPNPMLFDMALTQSMGPMQPQMQMFSGPPPGLFGQPAPLIPMSQANQMNMSLDGGPMQHFGGDY